MLCRELANRSKTIPRCVAQLGKRAAILAACLFATGFAQAATFDVNSPADVPDATPGDGQCETAVGNKVCTLRGAIQEANALAGADVIQLQANATYVLTRPGADETSVNGSLDISDSVDIVGGGPGSTIIDGNGAVTADRVFDVLPCIGNDANCALGQVVVSMTGISIRHGQAANLNAGGGLYSAHAGGKAVLTMTNCRVENNTAGTGGGIYFSGSMALTSSTIADNTATINSGGGAFLSGTFTIADSTFSGNVATSETGFGGGLYLVGSGEIRRSAVSGNHARYGGGIFSVAPDKALYIENSTLFGNASDGDGGGFENFTGTTTLANVTIAGNTANADRSGGGSGGGVFNRDSATLNVDNSIIANNADLITGSLFSVLNDCGGTIVSLGFNIVTHATCTIVGGHLTDAVVFGPFQFNGGPTKTLALLPGTGGIDAGNPGGCTDRLGAPLETDQRGLPRPAGAACDLGAYEVQPDLIFEDDFEA